jgi:hypothetical protein
MPIIPALGRLRKEIQVQGHPELQSEFVRGQCFKRAKESDRKFQKFGFLPQDQENEQQSTKSWFFKKTNVI